MYTALRVVSHVDYRLVNICHCLNIVPPDENMSTLLLDWLPSCVYRFSHFFVNSNVFLSLCFLFIFLCFCIYVCIMQ